MRINKTVSNMTQRLESVLTLKTYEVGGMVLFDEQPNYESPCQTSTVRQRFCDDLCFAMPDTSVPQCACAYGTLNVDRRTCTRKIYSLTIKNKKFVCLALLAPSEYLFTGGDGTRNSFDVNATAWFIY